MLPFSLINFLGKDALDNNFLGQTKLGAKDKDRSKGERYWSLTAYREELVSLTVCLFKC